MELTFYQQSTAFLFSLLLGAGIGAFYGTLKIARIFFAPQKTTVFIMDFIFMIISSLAVFIFSIAYMMGYVRVFVILGTVFGFFVYRLTLGRILALVYCPLSKFISKILSKISLKFKIFTKKLLKIAYKILYNTFNIRSIFRRRRENANIKEDSLKYEENK